MGSASPRRTQLLSALGYEHRVLPADIDETPHPFEAALPYVRRMAASKADAVLGLLKDSDRSMSSGPGRLETAGVVLTADTVVIADGMILGKPVDEAQGLGMLARLSGRSHVVSTAVSLRCFDSNTCRAHRADVCVQTGVSFRSVSVQEARRYWSSGEPRDKAGGYGIQGAASAFVSNVYGSYTNVIGLPLVETRVLLRALGIVPDLRRDPEYPEYPE